MYQRKLNLLLVLFSVLGGIAGWMAGEWLLHLWEGQLPNAVLMGLYFGVLAFFTGLMCLLAELLSPRLNGRGWRQRYVKESWKALLPATLVLLFVAGALLQLVYGLGFRKLEPPTNILLAIDTSGSMKETDPNRESFRAARDLVGGLEDSKHVAVVLFSDHAAILQPFADLGQAGARNAVQSVLEKEQTIDGKTNIEEALKLSMDHIQSSGAPGRSMVLLISDGYSEVNLSETLAPYRSGNTPIYTVGVKPEDFSGNRLLRQISSRTGGSYHSVNNAQELPTVFNNIYNISQKWHLAGGRTGDALFSAWYSCLRVLFLGIIGALMGVGLGAIFDNRFLAKSFAIGGSAAGLAAGLVLEFGLKDGGLPDWGVRALSAVILALVLGFSTLVIPFKKIRTEGEEGRSNAAYPRPFQRSFGQTDAGRRIFK